jgi:hypothetical protein
MAAGFSAPKPPPIPKVKFSEPKLATPKVPKFSAPKSPKATVVPSVKVPKAQPLSLPHVSKAKPFWLGNKTGTVRPPGAGKQHRELQISDTGYPTVSWK